MKGIWGFFTSTRLTLFLTILIVADVFAGSILLSYFPEDLGGIDMEIFFSWLLKDGLDKPFLTWWFFLLLFLLTLFAMNTVACSIDSIIGLFSPNQGQGKAKFRRLLSQIVHLGFITALAGHLVSSASGFRSANNYLVEGGSIPLPQEELSLRLNRLDVLTSNDGGMEKMDAYISLIKGDNVLRNKVVKPNSPLLYRGIGIYLAHHGEAPVGMEFNLTGNGVSETVEMTFRDKNGITFKDFRLALGPFIPDFAIDKEGRVYSASREFRNPAQRIEVYREGRLLTAGWVFFNYPDKMPLSFEGYKLLFSNLIYKPYAVLTINKDPGAVIVLTGGLIFMVALIGLLFIKGEGVELVDDDFIV